MFNHVNFIVVQFHKVFKRLQDKRMMEPNESSPINNSNNPGSQPQQSQEPIQQEMREKSARIDEMKIIMAIMAIIAIILLIVNITLYIKLSNSKQNVTEDLNLTFTISFENGTELVTATSTFTQGNIAQTLGFLTNKLDTELGNLNKGQEKTVTLNAEDAFGKYDKDNIAYYERITEINRSSDINRTQWISIDDFTQAFSEQPEIGGNYTTTGAPWPYKVLEKNSTDVKLSNEATLNQKIPYGFFEYEVTKITADKIVLTLQGNDTVIPNANGNVEVKFTSTKVIMTLTPTIGQVVQLGDFPESLVTGMNSTHIFLDSNSPYADQKIIVKIKRN